MAISIRDHELPDDSHNLYDVTFYTHQIHTLLTPTPSIVQQWLLTQTTQNHHQHSDGHGLPTIVGLDVEWRPNFSPQSDNPIATLQLCIGHSCLIFQIKHSPSIPQSLIDFLRDGEGFVFVGVGIKGDVEKLEEDYGLTVGNVVDLRGLAAEKTGVKRLKNAGLKELARVVLGFEISKPKRITMSKWDTFWLTSQQVQYACLDAFLSSEIGRTLMNSDTPAAAPSDTPAAAPSDA